jgi:DNA ligase-1
MAISFNVSKPISQIPLNAPNRPIHPIRPIPVHGLYLPEADLWLDPHRSKRLAVITHAHADHVASHETVICTPATAALLRARYSHKGAQVELDYNTPYLLGPYLLELLPAGHVLGSAMVHVTRASDGATLLYTGDFKLRTSPTAEPAAPKQADTLIMETTFGLPHYVFPLEETVREEVVAWCRSALEAGETPMLLGYSLGKAQEILALLAGADLPIAVHETVWRMCQVYESRGISFPPYEKFSPATGAGHVIILPPMVVKNPEFQALPNPVSAMLSGWAMDARARYQTGSDLVLPLSDHADYPGLLELVRLVKPTLVLTTHGFAAEFAQDLRRRGQEAWMLQGTEQLELSLTSAPASVNVIEPLIAEPTPFLQWLMFAEELAALRTPTQKEARLADHLSELSPDQLGSYVDWLAGAPATTAQRPHWSHLRAAVLAITGWHLSQYRALTQQLAEPALALPTALAQVPRVSPCSQFSLAELQERTEAVLRAPAPSEKISLLTNLFRELAPAEAHGVARWLSGDPALSVSEAILLRAFSQTYSIPHHEFHEAWWLLGSWGACAAAAQAGTLAAYRLQMFRPVLGALLKSSTKATVQIHYQAERVEIYDSNQTLVTAEFPALAGWVRQLPQDTILLGSVPASTAQLSSQPDFLTPAEPMKFHPLDLLWWDGASLAHLPQKERARLLQQAISSLPSFLQ